MELRVVSWNVDGWHTIRDAQLGLLEDRGAQLALLQEVTPASLDRLRAAGWHGDSALDLLPADHTERAAVRPRFACAVLARAELTVVDSQLIPGTSSPVRALACQLVLHGRELTAISAALPPGSTWGRAAKVAQAEAIFAAAHDAGSDVLVGLDRNGPRFERWDPSATQWWDEDPAEVFAAGAPHGLEDVLDRWYASNPDLLAQARDRRPDGPREVSYVERRADPPIERRYDVIMATEGFEVRGVRYRYQQAIDAGSDHGLVEAALAW